VFTRVTSQLCHMSKLLVGGATSPMNEDWFDDVYWFRIEHRFGPVRLCIRLTVFLLSDVFQACCVILHMISSLTNGLAVSIVQSKWKYTHDNRLGKLLIELVTAKTFV